jgi:hypothetical protein
VSRPLRIAFCGEGNRDSKVMPIFIDKILAELTPVEPFDLSINTQRWDTRHSFPEALVTVARQSQLLCHLLVVHVDADSVDQRQVRQYKVEPGLQALAKAGLPTSTLVWAIPVQAIEAWLLASATAFTRALTGSEERTHEIELPQQPGRLPTDKAKRLFDQTVYQLLARTQRQRRRLHPDHFTEIIAEELTLMELRRLSAFQQFESDFTKVITYLGYVAVP